MPDLLTETLIPLREAASHVAFRTRRGKPGIAGVYRAISIGVRGVHLETIRLPKGLATSEQAIERFIHRLSNPDQEHPVVLTPAASRKREATVERELDAAGL